MVLGWSSFRFLKIMTPGPKMAQPGGLSVFHRKIFKNLLLKLPGQFLQYFTGMFLGWSSLRFLKIMTPGPKMAQPEGLSVFSKENLKKIFSSETTWPISTIFHGNVPWVVFFQIP